MKKYGKLNLGDPIKKRRKKNYFIFDSAALIYNREKNKILLQKLPNEKFWTLPYTKVSFFDNSEEVIRKKIKEEFPWMAIKITYIGAIDTKIQEKNKRRHHMLVVYKEIYEEEITSQQRENNKTLY